MGWDSMFKVKHNLDTSSMEALAIDLGVKMKCKVVQMLWEEDAAKAKLLGIDIPQGMRIYPSSIVEDSDTILLSDNLFIARALVNNFGDWAQTLWEASTKEKFPTSQIKEVKDGTTCYCVDYGGYEDIQRSEIWNINSETLFGVPGFHGRRFAFNYLFKDSTSIHSQQWGELIEQRKRLYHYLKPIIKELPIYYISDQGDMQHLMYTESMAQFEQLRIKYGLTLFNLSSFIFENDFTHIPDVGETVLTDDFKDIFELEKDTHITLAP